MTIHNVKVENMLSASSDRPVANQFIISVYINTEHGKTLSERYFQSYDSIIARERVLDGKIVLDRDAWDYSVTTGRYRNMFLRESIAETRKNIKNGIYKLENLN